MCETLPQSVYLVQLQKHNALTVPLENGGDVVGEVVVEWSLSDGSSQSAATLTDTSLSPPSQTRSKTAYTQANGNTQR